MIKEKILSCNIYKAVEGKKDLMFFERLDTDDITKKYELSDDIKKFMIQELIEFGRYWISDEVLLRVRRD